MKTKLVALVVLSLFLASCIGTRTPMAVGDEPSWISEKQAQILCYDFLRHNEITNLEPLAVIRGGEHWGCIFVGNDTNATVKVFVNRKTREVRFDDSKP